MTPYPTPPTPYKQFEVKNTYGVLGIKKGKKEIIFWKIFVKYFLGLMWLKFYDLFSGQGPSKLIFKKRVGYMCIEESFEYIVNMDYGYGRGVESIPIRSLWFLRE